MDKAKDTTEAAKLDYATPHLVRYGTLSELTQSGLPVGSNDFVFGEHGKETGWHPS